MPSNADIVRTVTDALGRGDLLAVMGLVAKDVRWAVNAADREAAPWFQVYQGKRSLPDFFAELSQLTFTDFTLKASPDAKVVENHKAMVTTSGAGMKHEETFKITVKKK